MAAGAGEPGKLTAVTSGFVMAAAVTVVFNTALAWTKDACAPVTEFMKNLTGHHWTTHGLADLAVFAGLGVIFTRYQAAEKMDGNRLIAVLTGTVAMSALGLIVWFAFV